MSNSVLTGEINVPFTLVGSQVAVTTLPGTIIVPFTLGGLGTRFLLGLIPVPFSLGGKVGPTGSIFAFPEVVIEIDGFEREVIVDVDSERTDNV